jgi:hypothetical protein
MHQDEKPERMCDEHFPEIPSRVHPKTVLDSADERA